MKEQKKVCKRRGGTYRRGEEQRGEISVLCQKGDEQLEGKSRGRQERTCLTVRLMQRAKGGGQRIAVTHWESPIRRRQVNILSSQV